MTDNEIRLTPLQELERRVILLRNDDAFELVSALREYRQACADLLSPTRIYDRGRFVELLDFQSAISGIESLEHGSGEKMP